MIKDKNKQQRLLALFKALPNSVCEQIEQEYMPHYLIYHRKRNKFDCYCTHCRQHYTFIRNGTREWMNGVCHNNENHCMKCGYPVTCLSAGYGRGNILNSRNFAVFSKCENSIMIQCFKVYEKFEDGRKHNLIFDYNEKQRYYVSPGSVQHWTNAYTFNHNKNMWKLYWRPCKTENEPNFDQGSFYPNNSYTIINDDVINISDMKYAERCISDLDTYTCSVVCGYYIKYLCEFAKSLKEWLDNGVEPERCTDCGHLIKPAQGRTVQQIAEGTYKNYGRKLCWGCMTKEINKRRKEAEQNAAETVSGGSDKQTA